MANPNSENQTLAKGIRLTVIVEYSFENLIAVFLFHNGREFRGVLLENDTGLFPHGIPFSNKPTVEQKQSVKASPRSALDIKAGTENKPPDLSCCKEIKIELPATCDRFSYTTNPFLVNPRPVPPIPTVEMKPVAPLRKTVRDIRLRPRQTLCSKCKSAIHENFKGNNSSPNQKHNSSASKTSVNLPTDKKSWKVKSNVAPRTDPLPIDNHRKRRSSHQTPLVLLEDIKLKYMKPSEKKSSKASISKQPRGLASTEKTPSKNNSKDIHKLEPGKSVNPKVRSIRSSSINSAMANSSQNGNVHNWLREVHNASDLDLSVAPVGKHLKKDKSTNPTNEKNSKPSPAIKISIGDGAILKIPPRLPTEEAKLNEQQSWPQMSDISDCSNVPNQFELQHKKSKKSAKRAKEKDKIKTTISIEQTDLHNLESVRAPSPKLPKKHKKKHRHKHDEPIPNLDGKIDSHDLTMAGQSNVSQSNLPSSQESNDLISSAVNMFDNKSSIEQPRPRLLYTWKQNQGLSRVASSPKHSSANMSPSQYLFKSSPVLPLKVSNSPHRRKNASPARVISASPNWHIASPQSVVLKDYPLRSKSISGHSSSGLSSENLATSEHGINQVSEDSQSHSSGLDSNVSDFCDGEFEDIHSEDDFFFQEESPSLEREGHGEEDDNIKPLMMKIQTQNVNGCVLKEGREVRVGDIVWGKIPGFPWWPGRVSSITVTQRDNDVVITQLAKVCWFGSNTMSHVHCADLYPFLQEFKARYNKKKKGQYRIAIKQATIAAQMLTDAREDDFSFEGYE